MGLNNGTTYEERLIRLLIASERVGLARFALHIGVPSQCCQPSNEAYHGGRPAVRKKAFFAVEIPKSRPRLPV